MRARAVRAFAGVFGALVLTGYGLALATPAQAHNYLVSSTPAADSTLTELPESFDIVTNDNLLAVGEGAGGFALQVRDAAGLYYGDGCVVVSGPVMSSEPALGAAGVYTALWQVVSADGHTVSDEFTFTWAPVAEGDMSTGFAEPPVCGQATPGVAADPSPAAADDSSDDQGAAPAPITTTSATADDELTDVLWIGGAVLAVAVAVAVTLVIVGRRKKA